MNPLPTTERVTVAVTAPSKLAPLFSAARDVSDPSVPARQTGSLRASPGTDPSPWRLRGCAPRLGASGAERSRGCSRAGSGEVPPQPPAGLPPYTPRAPSAPGGKGVTVGVVVVPDLEELGGRDLHALQVGLRRHGEGVGGAERCGGARRGAEGRGGALSAVLTLPAAGAATAAESETTAPPATAPPRAIYGAVLVGPLPSALPSSPRAPARPPRPARGGRGLPPAAPGLGRARRHPPRPPWLSLLGTVTPKRGSGWGCADAERRPPSRGSCVTQELLRVPRCGRACPWGTENRGRARSPSLAIGCPSGIGSWISAHGAFFCH